MTAFTLGPDLATVEVLTFREGVLSAMAHDLLLRVTSFELAIDPDVPAVTARLDPASLRVVTAMRDGRPLPGALRPADVREIEATIAGTVLAARRFPEIRFVSTGVARKDDALEVRGELTLAGLTRPLALAVRHEGDRLVGAVRLHQPDFGIRPYRAMLGTLRVKPEVVVRVSLPGDQIPLPSAGIPG
jgi:polyisoprenoid-binding protein YceI